MSATKRIRSTGSSVAATLPSDRPWSPSQIFVTPVLFGTLGCGVLSALNCRRMGRPESTSGYLGAGIVLSVLLALAICAVPESATKPIGLLFGLLVGVCFAASQKEYLKSWMEAHVPEAKRERYYGDGVGVLFGVGLLCLGVQIGMTYLMYITLR